LRDCAAKNRKLNIDWKWIYWGQITIKFLLSIGF
jgi:hypothetical protein